MRFKRFFILLAAAGAGTLVYQITHAPQRIPGQRSFYSSVTGEGSLSETIRRANRGEGLLTIDSPPSGPIGRIGNPYARGRNGLLAPAYSSYSRMDSMRRPDSDEPASRDDMPLLQAAASGNVAAVESRLAAHALVDSRDADHRTPLMYASWNGHNPVIERLIAAGADTSLADNNGNNALDYAAGRGLTDTVQFLLHHAHASDDHHYMEYATILLACYAGDPVRLPSGKGKLVSINRLNPEGETPLHIAAGNGSITLMEDLFRRGAKADIANNEGRTAMHWAAWRNQPQAIEALLAHGADISTRDDGGDTPLLLAVQNGSQDAAKTLIARGADKYVADKQGKTAGIIAEDKGYKDLAAMLQ